MVYFIQRLVLETSCKFDAVVMHPASAAQNMVVLETMLKIDWEATYAGVMVLAKGRYLYYDYTTGHVDRLPATGTLLTVSLRFRVATMMQDSDVAF